jgi:serine protease Do
MIKTFKPIAALLFSIASICQLQAQDNNSNDNDNNSSENQNIIIHKKGPVKDKITVVIDSNNVTINGKPVDDFKSNDIDVITEAAPDMSFNFSGSGVNSFPRIAPQIRSFRDGMERIKTNSAFLGVMSEKTEKGAKITDVTKESAAATAGLKEGDIITKINNTTISDPDDLYKAIGAYKPDDKVTITYLRDGKQQTAEAVLGKSKQVRVYSWNSPNSQFDLKGFNPHDFNFSWDNDKPRLGIEAQDTEDGNGVKITDIDDDEDAPAVKAGLKKDDIITQVNGKAITSVDDLKESVKDVKKGDTIKLTIKRDNQTQTINVKFPKELKTINL